MSSADDVRKWNTSDKGKEYVKAYKEAVGAYKKGGYRYRAAQRRYAKYSKAERKGMEYTSDEEVMIITKEKDGLPLTDVEISKLLGRSLNAIERKRGNLKRKGG